MEGIIFFYVDLNKRIGKNYLKQTIYEIKKNRCSWKYQYGYSREDKSYSCTWGNCTCGTTFMNPGGKGANQAFAFASILISFLHNPFSKK